MDTYDVVVIGSGPAGLAIAYPLSEQGKQVAIIENTLWGGTCPNRGCDPKKMLMRGVEVKREAEAMMQSGIVGQVSIDWPQLMAHKRSYTDQVPQSTKQGLTGADIDTFYGTAAFVDPHTITINEDRIRGKQIVIATGQRPAVLDIPGSHLLSSSDDFLSLEQLPSEIIFIGGGYITFELAVIAQAAGATVHVVHHNDQPLKAFDQQLVQDLVKYLSDQGIIFHFSTTSIALTQEDAKYTLKTDKGTLNADLVIGATGRIPNIDGLQLDQAGVAYEKQGIITDSCLRTNQSHIFAIGDVLSKQQPKLTPVASFEAEYLVDILLGHQTPIDYPLIPTLVFGHLKLARIGLSEATIRHHADEYHFETIDLSDWYTYKRINDAQAKIKFTYDQENHLVAITVLSAIADTLINDFVFVLGRKSTIKELEHLIFAYPSPSSDLSAFTPNL